LPKLFFSHAMLNLMFFIKLLVTVGTVLGLSVIAERVGPKAAGILAGYPLGAAIALFFIGLEIGPKFAADSAVYTMIGLAATQVFVYFYFKTTLLVKRFNILAASLLSAAGYFLAIWLLHFIHPTKWLAVAIPIASVFLFRYLFREIPNVTIAQKIRLTFKVVMFRSFLAACFILMITGTAKLVGPAWAGLFSAFPTTLFPLLLIVHLTYDKAHVHTIIKNFPLGLGSLITYSLAVSILYPICGVYVGTGLCLAAATGYLFVYRLFAGRG
jgi:hypothetical protein